MLKDKQALGESGMLNSQELQRKGCITCYTSRKLGLDSYTFVTIALSVRLRQN